MSPEARERSFDELTRGLASGELSRRKALRLMGAALVGGTLASLGIGEAAADDECKPTGKKCRKNHQCCSGNCDSISRTCAAAGGCPSGTVELGNGTCAIACTGFGVECPGCSIGCAESIAHGLVCVNQFPENAPECTEDAHCAPGEGCIRTTPFFGNCASVC